MKRFAIAILCCLLFISNTVNAFKITDIQPDDSFLIGLGADIESDKAYLKSISKQYSEKYMVTEETYADITDIDSFFEELSAPLTLTELDRGKTEFRSNIIKEENLKSDYTSFKVLGGHGGYSAEFEPLLYFNIHRNITLVGGYARYKKTHVDSYDAYWQYVSEVQLLTKEIIPYNTRVMLIERFQHLESFISDDKSFKIFLLKNGKIDSMYERGDA